METTLTMTGLQAVTGAPRLRAAAPLACPQETAMPSYRVHSHQVSGHRQASTWISGGLAKATSVVFDGTNRPPRPLSELSP